MAIHVPDLEHAAWCETSSELLWHFGGSHGGSRGRRGTFWSPGWGPQTENLEWVYLAAGPAARCHLAAPASSAARSRAPPVCHCRRGNPSVPRLSSWQDTPHHTWGPQGGTPPHVNCAPPHGSGSRVVGCCGVATLEHVPVRLHELAQKQTVVRHLHTHHATTPPSERWREEGGRGLFAERTEATCTEWEAGSWGQKSSEARITAVCLALDAKGASVGEQRHRKGPGGGHTHE